ncbi:MAG: glycosyltransferase family 2 protein [Patescibacteria group bacterium]|nr:glycosyltransferase family 2 protein [Patescibacteria group bacterium]
MKLAVAFLCYNESSAPYLPEFLKSLDAALRRLEAEIFVFAGDNSDRAPFINQELLSRHNLSTSFPVKLLAFDRNLGFAAAYNRLIAAAKEAGADYFLMINPDMLLAEDMIAKLLSVLSERIDLAAACPKIYRWDFAGKRLTNIIDSCGIGLASGLRFYDLGQGQEDYGQYEGMEIIGPSGAAALFRISALEKIKEHGQYFDERFFMYKEDCDLSYRLYRAGQETALVPGAIAYHDRSSASQKNLWQTWRHWRKRSRLTRSWSFTNQNLIFAKYFHSEGYFSRFLIIIRLIFMFLFSLILAPFLLKTFFKPWKMHRSID